MKMTTRKLAALRKAVRFVLIDLRALPPAHFEATTEIREKLVVALEQNPLPGGTREVE